MRELVIIGAWAIIVPWLLGWASIYWQRSKMSDTIPDDSWPSESDI